jgi:hypothetical protein
MRRELGALTKNSIKGQADTTPDQSKFAWLRKAYQKEGGRIWILFSKDQQERGEENTQSTRGQLYLDSQSKDRKKNSHPIRGGLALKS